MMTPPIARIGAATSSVQVISTSICTCCTSLVVRVMSDGAPNCDTSRSENSPTRWKIAPRRSRPSAIDALAPKYTAMIAQTICSEGDGQHHPAGRQDVADVALGDALSMMSALRLGRYSDAIDCAAWNTPDRRRAAASAASGSGGGCVAAWDS